MGTKTIETNKLILRRFTKEDAQEIYEPQASDSESFVNGLNWDLPKQQEA